MVCSGQCNKAKGHGASVQAPDPGSADEIWGSDDEDVSPYADLKRAHVNQGYLDGITRAQESGLQKGFDDGFPKGAELGMMVGEILAKHHGTPSFNQAKKDLNITRILDKQYFDDQLDLKDQHCLIEQWKTTKVENNEG